jgi:hypothetical protein
MGLALPRGHLLSIYPRILPSSGILAGKEASRQAGEPAGRQASKQVGRQGGPNGSQRYSWRHCSPVAFKLHQGLEAAALQQASGEPLMCLPQ